MTGVEDPLAAAPFRTRLDKGAPMLFEIEMGTEPRRAEYATWLRGYEEILADYEAACDREEMAHAKD